MKLLHKLVLTPNGSFSSYCGRNRISKIFAKDVPWSYVNCKKCKEKRNKQNFNN